MPVIAIVGAHNSGKTTFIQKVVRKLQEDGYNVSVIKHDPKGKAETDKKGKDSYKIFEAGASQVIVASPTKISSFIRTEKPLNPAQIIERFVVPDTDLVIIEGFKHYKDFDKFEVIRKEENRNLLTQNPKGVITDYYQYPLTFSINDETDFVQYLKDTYLRRS
ncbi:MAG: molybdopterin-guanine dinucleotide biosynthesis protein B [Aquificae bacterium]|nr:molybdopterin-guanine dinucleotide biosynthesis protein B [Aquificota bacterium]